MRNYLFGKRLSLFEYLAACTLGIALGSQAITFWPYLLGLIVVAVVATAIGENL